MGGVWDSVVDWWWSSGSYIGLLMSTTLTIFTLIKKTNIHAMAVSINQSFGFAWYIS